MAALPYRTASITQIPALRAASVSESEWKPVRHDLGIRAFGVNAYVAAAAGEQIVKEHDELASPGTTGQEHEELYYVGRGHATFTVAGETVDAPEGTFVFVRDPAAVRSAVANTEGTIVLAVGAQPGVPFQVSSWERRHTADRPTRAE